MKPNSWEEEDTLIEQEPWDDQRHPSPYFKKGTHYLFYALLLVASSFTGYIISYFSEEPSHFKRYSIVFVIEGIVCAFASRVVKQKHVASALVFVTLFFWASVVVGSIFYFLM